jgi:glycosyltransferase involved in cell wall biosynthesis
MRAVGAPGHVLVVAYDFPPHAAIGTMRTLRVVQTLRERDWDVTVLTGDPSTYLPSTPVDMALLERVPPGVRVVQVRAWRPWLRLQRALRGARAAPPAGGRSDGGAPQRRPVRRHGRLVSALARAKDVVDAALTIPDRESGWCVPALVRGVWEARRAPRPDVIYSSAPPWTGQLVAAGLQRALRRPWVADFRDPWARAPWRGDRYRFALSAAGRLERYIVRRADRIVFVAAANRDDFEASYGPAAARRFDVVPNGCDPMELAGLEPDATADAPCFVLLHAGSLYAGRTPVPVLEGVATAIRRGSIDPARFRLRFLGTSGVPGLAEACERLGLHDVVECLPRVPREQGLRAMVSASCLLLLQPGHTVSVPGKLYEYLATGRPIVAVAEEGETAEIVRRSGLGVSVRPEDTEGIVRALVWAVERGWVPTQAPPRELYDGYAGAGRIVDILTETVRKQEGLIGLGSARVGS